MKYVKPTSIYRSLLLIFTIWVSFSCDNSDALNGVLSYKDNLFIEDLEEQSYVTTSVNHLAFPDLSKFNNQWYVTYREADGHLFKSFAKIKVLRSNDFKNWTLINTFEINGIDLRDPKFSYNDQTNEFYLHFMSVSDSNNGSVRKNVYSTFNLDSGIFENVLKTLKTTTKYPEDWFWRPMWHDGNLYSAGYGSSGIRLYKHKNLSIEPDLILDLSNQGWSEASLLKVDNRFFTVVRTYGETKFGVSESSDNVLFQWKDLPMIELGGPNMKYYGGNFVIAGRQKGGCSLFLYNLENNITELKFTLPAPTGDNAYPGLWIEDSTLFGVYYVEIPNRNNFAILSFKYNL